MFLVQSHIELKIINKQFTPNLVAPQRQIGLARSPPHHTNRHTIDPFKNMIPPTSHGIIEVPLVDMS